MINWNDIRVEQQIAQERYDAIIERSQTTSTTDLFLQGRSWFGSLLITWGHQLRRDVEWTPTTEWTHSIEQGR